MFTLGDNQYTLEQLKGFASKRGEDFDSYFMSLQQMGLQGEGYTPSVKANKTADLPQITREDVDLQEEEFVTQFKSKLGALGFKIEQANVTLGDENFGVTLPFTDAVTISSPKDKDGNRVTETFNVDEFALLQKRSAGKINDFVKEHADKSGVDLNFFSAGYKTANDYYNSLDVKNMSSKELFEAQNSISTDIFNSGGVLNKVANKVAFEMKDFKETTINSLSKKYNTLDISENSEAMEEYTSIMGKEFDKRLSNSDDLKNIEETTNRIAQQVFGTTIELKVREEGEEEVFSETAVGRAILKSPVFDDFLKGIYGTATVKLPKAAYEFTQLNEAKRLEQINADIEELQQKDVNEKVYYGGNLFTPEATSNPEIAVKAGNYTVAERIEQLKKQKPILLESIGQAMVKSKEYQEKMQKINIPELYDDDLSISIDGDKVGRIIGDQLVQLLSVAFTASGSTLAQEGGNAYAEITSMKAAMKTFPKLEPKEALLAFRKLPFDDMTTKDGVKMKGQRSLILDLIDKGESDTNIAFGIGLANAGLDSVGGFVTIKKATKFIPSKLLREWQDKAYKEFLKYGWKTIGSDVTVAMFAETLTEQLQEGVNLFGVSRATGVNPEVKEIKKRLLEAGTQALIATGPLVGGGQVITTGSKELLTKYVAHVNPEHKRNYINRQREKVEQDFKSERIDKETRDKMQDQLDAMDESLNLNLFDSKEAKEQYIDAATEDAGLRRQEEQLENELKEQRKDEENQGFTNVDTELKLKKVKRRRAKLKKKQFEAINIDNYLNSLKSISYAINNTEDGILGDKKFTTFDNVEEAIKYIDDKGLNFASEQQRQDFLDGKSSAIAFGNEAVGVKDVAIAQIKKGDIFSTNSIHHDGLHLILQSFTNEQLQEAFLKTELEFLKTNDPELAGAYALAMARFEQYRNDPNYKGRRLIEEYFTSVSDALKAYKLANLNTESATVFSLLGEAFGKMFKKNTGMNLNLENLDAGNMLTFIKQYNSFNGKTGVVTPTKTTAKSVGTDQQNAKESKEASDQVQKIFEERGVAGAMDIIDLFKPITARIAEERRNAPNYDKELLMSEIEIGKRGIFDLIRDYKVESGVPLAAYINTNLRRRAIEASRRVLGEEFTEDVSTRVDIAEREVDLEVSRPRRKKINLAERLGVKNKVDEIISKKISDLDINNLNFKNLKNLVPEIVGELYGISPKKIENLANITKKELQSAQMFINKNADLLIAMLPEGATSSGTATGVPKTLLNEFYTKTSRAKMAETGTKAGLAIQVKNKNIDKAKFLEVFGIVDGKPVRTDRNTSARVLAIANQTGKMLTNQSVRQQLLDNGQVASALFKIEDGKSPAMESKAAANLTPEKLAEFMSRVPSIGNIMSPLMPVYRKKYLTEAMESVYEGVLTDNEITSLTNDIHNIIKKYVKEPVNNVKITKKPEDFNKYLIDELLNFDLSILEITGVKSKTQDQLFLDLDLIKEQRAGAVIAVKKLIDKHGIEQGLRYALAFMKPMYAGASKIADGRYDVNSEGDVFYIGDEAVKKLKKAKGKETLKNRKQVFKNVPDFVNVLNKGVPGLDIVYTGADLRTAIFNYKGKAINVNTSVIDQSSKTFINKIKNEGEAAVKKQSLKEAKEARELVNDLITIFNEESSLSNTNLAMMLFSLNSNMKAPMRRAANLLYVSENYNTFSKPGSELEYEHMIPANWMMIKTLQANLAEGGIKDLDSFYKNYNVAIIPKTMDKNIKAVGYNSIMPSDYKLTDPAWKRYYNNRTLVQKDIVAIREIGTNKIIGENYAKVNFIKDPKNAQTFEKAIQKGREVGVESKGISILDFDDTLAVSQSLVKFTTPEGTTGSLTPAEYASTYEDLLGQGYVFDFSEFNKVIKGRTAPLFQKALKLANKFGTKDMFVLTARPPESAVAIFEFLKANGLNIPLKNITGLANSTAEAKALWVAEKVADGYNDFYFADDALQNVQAVKNILDQFDVKSKVRQARGAESKAAMNKKFNEILENVTGIAADKRFGLAKARKRGASKGKFRFFIPPSHEDFVGLLYNFMGKGRTGDGHRDFFENSLIKPLNRAYRELDAARQSIANDYKALNKQMPEVKKLFKKEVPTGDFTYEDAIRVYLFDKHGNTVPGLSKKDQADLVSLVRNDENLLAYAEALNIISKQETYVTPTDTWDTGDIRVDLDDATGRVGRAQFFKEFNDNVDVIFSTENLNKIEAAYGKEMRDSILDMLYRIQTGRNRPQGQDGYVNVFVDYLNGSVSTVMFFNVRSAILQQLSFVNFINFADNNLFAAAKAFANQKQYWADWAMLFNSDFMKQRRGGIRTDVNGAELAQAVAKSDSPTRTVIQQLLQIGFLPTQIGDNIAIATGGASFYRNRVNTYLEQGSSKKEAEEKAFADFQEIAEATQQSAREDMVSKQQSSIAGKIILNFQNVTSQYNRLMKKSFSDLINRRISKGYTTQAQSDLANVNRILYYGAVQNIIFYSLQSALFMMLFDDDDEEFFDKKKERVLNGSLDSILRGAGIYGAIASTLKNVVKKFREQRESKRPDMTAVAIEALNLSPVIGIKASRIVGAEKTLVYDKRAIEKMGDFDIDNPHFDAYTAYVEAILNLPLNRVYRKTINTRNAFDSQYKAYQRVLFFSGYTTYNLGIKNKEVEKYKKRRKKKQGKKIHIY